MKETAIAGAHIGIKIANVLINFLLLVALLIFMALGFYGLWDNQQIEAEGTPAAWQAYKPGPNGEELSFEELRAINPEVQAWLTLYGTNVDYPVVYSDNEWKYLNRNPKGEHSLAGSLFFDSQTLPDLSSYPTVIYGHHMAHKAMFGQLDDYKNVSFMRKYRYGNYHYNGRDWGIEIIGIFTTSAYDSSVYRPMYTSSQPGREQYVARITEKMEPKLDVTVRPQDGLLLMSTCASDETNSRTVVVARITDETFPNLFGDEQRTGTGLFDDRGWFGIPKLAWWLFFATVAIFFLIYMARRKDGKDKEVDDENVGDERDDVIAVDEDVSDMDVRELVAAEERGGV